MLEIQEIQIKSAKMMTDMKLDYHANPVKLISLAAYVSDTLFCTQCLKSIATFMPAKPQTRMQIYFCMRN